MVDNGCFLYYILITVIVIVIVSENRYYLRERRIPLDSFEIQQTERIHQAFPCGNKRASDR